MPERHSEIRTAALFSLFDKTGAAELARVLHDRGTEIYATGGTRTFLEQHGVPARDVGEVTGFPELFGGRVKTLHPKVFGGILYDRADDEHRGQAEKYAIPEIVVVAVNLYPFEATVRAAGHDAMPKRSNRSISAASRFCARRRRTSSTSRC